MYYAYCRYKDIVLEIISDGKALLSVKQCSARQELPADPIALQCAAELEEYFAGRRKNFTVPYLIEGTPFARAVYRMMVQIPYGQTMSYGELALAAGYPGAARAVGTLCRKNSVPLIVPCHRVVRSRGIIGAYSLGGPLYKHSLLELEQRYL